MLRVFKVTSPMNVGAWVLFVNGGASNMAAVLELVGRLGPIRRAAGIVAAFFGPPLATYTGVLLSDTAVPVWHEARRELPLLFGASAAASAGAAACLFLGAENAGPARRLAVGGVVAEGIVMIKMTRRLGAVGEVYRRASRPQAVARGEGTRERRCGGARTARSQE